MRESIGGAWILSIVVVFMAIFIAFVAISINYSNAYKLKTAMVTIVEQYDGFNPNTVSALNDTITAYGYIQSGFCQTTSSDEVVYGVTGTDVVKNPTNRQSYCIRREYSSASNNGNDKYYYTIDVFFGFNLPVLGNLYTFKVSGETNSILYPTDPYF